MKTLSRIALGTAGWGQHYGLAQSPPLNLRDINELLECAAELGIYKLDTAIGYGETSRLIAGSIVDETWEVTTKFAQLTLADKKSIKDEAIRSVRELGLETVGTLLVHDSVEYGKTNLVLEALTELRDEGFTENFGFSIYSFGDLHPNAIELATSLQLPGSIVHREQVNHALDHWLNLKAGRTLQVRSIFLQGLLIANRSKLRVAPQLEWALQRFDEWCNDFSLDPFEACVRYAATIPGADVVVGIQSCQQLRDLDKIWSSEKALPADLPNQFLAHQADPRRWGQHDNTCSNRSSQTG